MPGSKTFTGTKSNELLEFDLINEFTKITEDNINKTVQRILTEFFNILCSAIITAALTFSTNLFEMFNDAVKLKEFNTIVFSLLIGLSIFVCFYLLVKGIWFFISFLSNLLFNNRRFERNVNQYKRLFHYRTYNYIMRGLSFENKSKYYADLFKQTNVKPSFDENIKENPHLDLINMYISQAAYHFEVADEELSVIIPPKMSGKKEKRNIEFMDKIGLDDIKTGLDVSSNSLIRLQLIINDMNKMPSIQNTEFEFHLKSSSKRTQKLIGHFDSHLKRVKELNMA